MMNDIIQTLKGHKTAKPPVWFMRQAGRYLPEYRELRASAGGFMQAVFNSDMAAEITLQPLRRYPEIDAAILFSDILVIPYALGQDVQFLAGEGPHLGPMDDLVYQPEKLDPVLQTIRNVRKALPEDKTVIGFAGAPWTVACYMISGSNHDEFLDAKKLAFNDPEALDTILNTVTEATLQYLLAQIEAGANVVQIFESWCGLLTGHRAEFDRFILDPTRRIVAGIKEQYPDIPVIGFPREANSWIPLYAEETGIDAVGLDWSVDLVWANENLPAGFPVQGNLDPAVLLIGGEALKTKARHIIETLKDRPFIFNLGHGVIKETPPQHLAELLAEIKL